MILHYPPLLPPVEKGVKIQCVNYHHHIISFQIKKLLISMFKFNFITSLNNLSLNVFHRQMRI